MSNHIAPSNAFWDTSDWDVEEDDRLVRDAGAVRTYKLAQGDNVLRFLPGMTTYVDTKGRQRVRHFVVSAYHFIKLEGMDGVEAHACPRIVNPNANCISCRYVEWNMGDPATGRPGNKNAVRSVSRQPRIKANVLDRASGVVSPFEFGPGIWADLKGLRTNPHSGGDFLHPVNGFDIVITREGSGKDTQYKVTPARAYSPVAATNEEIEWILSQRTDLEADINYELTPETYHRLELEMGGLVVGAQVGRPQLGAGGSYARPAFAAPPQHALPAGQPAQQVGAGMFANRAAPQTAPQAPQPAVLTGRVIETPKTAEDDFLDS